MCVYFEHVEDPFRTGDRKNILMVCPLVADFCSGPERDVNFRLIPSFGCAEGYSKPPEAVTVAPVPEGGSGGRMEGPGHKE